LGGAVARSLCGFQITGTFLNGPEPDLGIDMDWARLDVRDPDAVEELFHRLSLQGRLGCVVFAVGRTQDSLLLRTSVARWQEVMQVNLDGPWAVLRASLKYLPSGARVVLLGSRVGEEGRAGQCAYSAAKSATQVLLRCAAREGAERGLAFNMVMPGFVLSPLHEGVAPRARQEQESRSLGRGKAGAEVTARAVSFLLSAEAQGISGQVFHADDRLAWAPAST
jgi:NAD(P)-dependent dehydrogenase (short-subunit alcohol dehydrogenase family)